MTKTMLEYANGEVRIGGSLLHTVKRKNLTPAEVVVLRAEHGHDAVINLAFSESKSVNIFQYGTDEIDRLIARKYSPEKIKAAFPGHTPQLPTKFKDIGVKLDKEVGLLPKEQKEAEERSAKEKEEEELKKLLGDDDDNEEELI